MRTKDKVNFFLVLFDNAIERTRMRGRRLQATQGPIEVTLYDPQQHHSHAFLYGHDPGVTCLCYAALALWYLGYPDQALQKSREALALTQRLSHPYSLAYAPTTAARIHQLRREGQRAEERAEAVITLSTKQEFPFLLALGTIVRGWALTEQGQMEDGVAQIHQGLDALSAMGAGAYTRANFLTLLAEAYGRIRQVEKGLSALGEALAVVDKTGERFYEAELYRLKGELILQSSVKKSGKSKVKSGKLRVPSPQHLTPSTQEAEACFLKAIEVARKQQAKS